MAGGSKYRTVRLVASVIALSLLALPALAQSCISGGPDDDTDFELIDLAAFQRCFKGSAGGTPRGECAAFDFDADNTIDLPDLPKLVACAKRGDWSSAGCGDFAAGLADEPHCDRGSAKRVIHRFGVS